MATKRFSEFRKGSDRIKVYAKGFNSNRSVQLTGNVTGSAQSDMDEGSTLSIATTIADNAVTNSKLSDGAVSTSKLQDDAVTSAKIDTGAVTVNKLSAAAVETDKIANGAVTLAKISTSAIDDAPTDSSDNLVTSGGVKAALDDIEATADSAIQGVKVDGTALTPDEDNVVSIPNASTSDKGAVQLAGNIGATVASENNKAASEKAVRDAINDLDAEVTSNDGTNVQFKVTETDGMISAVNITTDNTENKNNKVNSVRAASSATDTAYPSEKAVATALDAKANANKVVAIADASVLRRGQVGQGWYKLAETTTPRANYNINSVFDVVLSSNGGECRGSFVMSVRYEGTGVVNVFAKSLFCDAWFPDYPIKIVATKVSSTALKVELYFGVKPSVTTNVVYSGISISEQNAGNYGGTNEKNTWTYTSYTDVAGSAEPESDPTSNKEVVDVDIVARQHAIVSPTENNIVAMDADGLVKDSGKSVLLGTQTWDGTSDAKIPTAKAVQGAIDAKVKGNADVSGMGTDDTHAYSGKAVSTAISNAITGTTGGFLGNKTVAAMNAYAIPKMGDNAIVTDTGTIIVGNTPCTVSSAPAEIRWTTDGSWVVTSSNYVNKNDVATAQTLGLVKTNPTDGGVELNSNNQMVVHGWDGKASASDVTSLTGRVTTAEGDIDTLQASVGGKLNTSDAVWTIDDSDDAIIVDDDFMTWMFQA